MAGEAFRAEEVPVGAVVVWRGEVIARARNEVELRRDATAHAEMLALREAARVVGDWRLTECSLYVTKEPCPMCAGALANARIGALVYGVGDPKWGAAGGAMNLLQYPTHNHRAPVIRGVREPECRHLLLEFFRLRRVAGE